MEDELKVGRTSWVDEREMKFNRLLHKSEMFAFWALSVDNNSMIAIDNKDMVGFESMTHERTKGEKDKNVKHVTMA